MQNGPDFRKPPNSSLIGRSLGRFQVVEKIGAGGMGAVYRAHDTSLGRDVALKVMLWEEVPGTPAQDLLLYEARTASTLNHPGICTIYEVGKADKQTYIAMELVPGKPLASLIPPEEGLPFDALIRTAAQIAEAIAHAHAHGIIHRDLKTANIMITPEGRVKVLDFGLAMRLPQKELATLTLSRHPLADDRSIAGTLPYLSPEVLSGETADKRSDIWALGVVLYEMATGTLPFKGRTAFELTSAILREPVEPLPARVPAPLRTVLIRCLAKVPSQRYLHAGELAAAIEAIGSDSRVLPTSPPRRRNLSRWLVTTGLVIMALILGLIFQVSKRRPPMPSSLGQVQKLSTGERLSPNKEANEYYERAIMVMRTRFDVDAGRRMLERALDLDSHFAAARAEYGFTYVLQIDGGISNDAQLLYKSEEELLRALKDDPESGRVHSALAAVYFFQGRKELIPGEVDKALKANPSDLDAPMWLINYYTLNDDFVSARNLAEKTLETNPSFFPARMNLGDILRQEGASEEAIRELDKILEQDPKNIYALVYLWRVYLEKGDSAQARLTLDRVPFSDRRNFMTRLAWAVQFAAEGARSEALKEMDDEVLKFLEISPSNISLAASFYAILGETDKALEWLDRAVRIGDDRAQWFERDPLLANIRNHPHFKQIMDSITYKQDQQKQQLK
jgi:serine/threonine protein kinase/Tfp pilus assembly protein PilF